jgi:hypothetical protein
MAIVEAMTSQGEGRVRKTSKWVERTWAPTRMASRAPAQDRREQTYNGRGFEIERFWVISNPLRISWKMNKRHYRHRRKNGRIPYEEG